MKKYIFKFMTTVFALLLCISMQVSAKTDKKIQISEEGKVNLSLPKLDVENISSLQLQFKITPTSTDTVQAGFAFEGLDAKVMDYRYDTQKGLLTIYISDTEAIFKQSTNPDTMELCLGEVTVKGGQATVEAVEKSLKMVNGAKVEEVEIDYPENSVVLGDQVKIPTPEEKPAPTPEEKPTSKPEERPTDNEKIVTESSSTIEGAQKQEVASEVQLTPEQKTESTTEAEEVETDKKADTEELAETQKNETTKESEKVQEVSTQPKSNTMLLVAVVALGVVIVSCIIFFKKK